MLRRIVLPQVMPGILSGSLIVFGLSASAFAIPGLLGGRRLKMVATVVYDEYLHELNWPLGAAVALTLLLANLVVMLSYNRVVEGSLQEVARVRRHVARTDPSRCSSTPWWWPSCWRRWWSSAWSRSRPRTR